MWRCPACGASTTETQRFCGDCGHRLLVSCPSCTALCPAEQRFCAECGHPLDTAPSPRAAADDAAEPGDASGPDQTRTPVAERRLCSVLFCDLVGFTTISEQRDPEEVRELLSQYFDRARVVIGRYGGVVEKFIGDAVMAVWGTPVAAEGDAERAVRAGLELVETVARLGIEARIDTLAARVGIVTDEVAVTIGASMQGMVAGDPVNTAARVQSAAQPGTVLVDSATRHLTIAAVGFDDAGTHALKGKAEPQQLWQATRVHSGVGGAQRIDGLEAPLLGRDVELRLLKDLFHACVERRTARLLAIEGSAGVGKSRLGRELEKYIDGLADPVRWHRGRCLSYGEGVTFWALAEIVRQRLGIAEEDSAATAADKLVASLETYVPDDAERGEIGLRLARLLGVPLRGDDGQPLPREELYAGWRMFFERLAAEQPVILMIEDLHYADSGLLDFLDYLVDWSRDASILVVTFGRPEVQTLRPGWGVGRHRSLLTLDPLDPPAMAALLDALVPGMPQAASDALSAQAAGIPLFAVESIRSLIDRDLVVPREGVYRLVAEIGDLKVPDTLHGLFAARIDALAPATRMVLTDAAVLGSAFPAIALVAVSGAAPSDVERALDDLVSRDVLQLASDPLSAQRGDYAFAHEMLRQVAYGTMSRRDRKTRHLAVADHLRTAFPDDGEEVSAVVARHYLDALEAVPNDSDSETLREQALLMLTRAAERAQRIGSRVEEAGAYAEAATLAEHRQGEQWDAAAGALWANAAVASLALGDFASGLQYAERSETAFVRAGDERAAARSSSLAGAFLSKLGRTDEGAARSTAALDVLRQSPDEDTVIALLDAALSGPFQPGAEAILSEAVTLAQATDVQPRVLVRALGNHAVALAKAGRPVESTALLTHAATLAERAGESSLRSSVLLNLSSLLCAHDPAAAAEAAATAAELARRSGSRVSLGFAIANLVQAQLSLGEWAAAEAELARALEVDAVDHQLVRADRAWIAALRGDALAAREDLDDLTTTWRSEDAQDEAELAYFKAAAAYADSRREKALELAQAALADLPSLGATHEAVRWAWPLAARVAHELGRDDEVRELLSLLDPFSPVQIAPMLHAERELVRARLSERDARPDADGRYDEALRALRSRSTPYHLALGLLDRAAHLAETGRYDEAQAPLSEAEQLGEQLGCQPVVERAARLRRPGVAMSSTGSVKAENRSSATDV